jgi:hypothetical protein
MLPPLKPMPKPDSNKPKPLWPSKKESSNKPLVNYYKPMRIKFPKKLNAKNGELNGTKKKFKEPKKSKLLNKLKPSLPLNWIP